MPPQIKHDLNRSGWESTDMPSVCERCLPDNPYVQMLKEDYGAECKICTRPYTVFRWKADRSSRQKRSIICLTCARLKNCCQCCMLDLSFGLPITIRDAALKMIAPGPGSSINREYYAQNHEKEIEDGRGGVEAYEKTDEKAMELLKHLAQTQPHHKRRRLEEAEAEAAEQDSNKPQAMRALPAPDSLQDNTSGGLVRPRGNPSTNNNRSGPNSNKSRVFPSTAQLPPRETDWLPPQDKAIKSLFVIGVEDDLPEYKLREHFAAYGKLTSLVCSHRSHCAYINFMARADAETAAAACKGRAVVAGCPLRVTWGKPRQLDTLDRDQRMAYAREGRAAVGAQKRQKVSGDGAGAGAGETGNDGEVAQKSMDDLAAMAPPGAEDVAYASLKGN